MGGAWEIFKVMRLLGMALYWRIRGSVPLSRAMECTASGVSPDVICGL